jgi:hypothetical protein
MFVCGGDGPRCPGGTEEIVDDHNNLRRSMARWFPTTDRHKPPLSRRGRSLDCPSIF